MKLPRFGERVPLDLGVWVGATGGDFVVEARTPRYDQPLAAAQIDAASRRTLRAIPPELVDGWQGLANFLKVTVRDRRGEVVATKRLTFCPNSFERQRLGDGGPDRPRYPQMGCYAGFPFLRGMLWGIDRQWRRARPPAANSATGWSPCASRGQVLGDHAHHQRLGRPPRRREGRPGRHGRRRRRILGGAPVASTRGRPTGLAVAGGPGGRTDAAQP